MFKCSTDYDYYLIENVKQYTYTTLNDYNNNEYNIIINEKNKFIPNHSINEVYELIKLDDEYNGFINDQNSYECRKKWMSNIKNEIYKYPCIYSINSKNQPSLKYSKINTNGHFNICKFIFSNGEGYICDYEGIYGLTQWGYAIECDKNNMNNIIKMYESNKFKNIINAIQLTSNKYNYPILRLFKKDFWKEFI
jgi:hypothetical protein